MIRDLEAQECVDRLEGFRIGRDDVDTASAGSVAIPVCHTVLQPLQGRGARNVGGMDEMRQVEAALAEERREVRTGPSR